MAAAKRPGAKRDTGGRFVKGVSGNPGGRPKGLAALVQSATKDGEKLVAFYLKVFEGKLKGATLRDRMAAADWLADRGFGRPVQAVEHSGDLEMKHDFRGELARRIATLASRKAAGEVPGEPKR